MKKKRTVGKSEVSADALCKLAEENNRRMATVVRDSNDAITIQDIDGRIMAWNHGAELMYGYSEEEVLEMNIECLTVPGKEVEQNEFTHRLLAGEKISSFETQRVTKDGRILDVWLTITKLMDDTGKPIGVASTERDITERKRTEEDLQKANLRFQKSLEELKLTQQKVIQQERLSALGQMASGIAHDFNNVLMPIVGFSELLMSDPSALDDRKESMHLIGMILSAGKDAGQIVRRLRAVYRDDDVDYKMVDILRITESAISLTMPKWKEEMNAKGITIEMVTDFHPVPQIKGNEGEIREALTNLIFNAVDAMPKGGVITFHIFRKNDISIVLEVTDTGLGMDQETLRRCVEPFFTTKGVQGSGLGLAMVHGIVERHAGIVEIESKSGAGTTIRMLFPVPIEIEDTKKELEKESEPLPLLRILVIDDETRSRNLIARLLKADTHLVEVAGEGREGLAMLRQGEFDLIITDRAMPIISGDEVAKEAQNIRPGIPVIMLTGFGDIMKDSGECPSGVTRVMSKPLTRQDLRRVMAKVMAGKLIPVPPDANSTP